MCVIQRGLQSEIEGNNMILKVAHYGGDTPLYSKQVSSWTLGLPRIVFLYVNPSGKFNLCSYRIINTGTKLVGKHHHQEGFILFPGCHQDSVKDKSASLKRVLSRLPTLLQVLGSICFLWPLVFLCSMTFVLVHAHGEEQNGVCKLTDSTIIWDMSSVVHLETMGLSPCSTTEQLSMHRTNTCIPHGHRNAENDSPSPLGPPMLSKADVKMVVTVLAIIGAGIGLAGCVLYKRWLRAFTEADIIRGLASEPAVARRSNPTFEIPPNIECIAN